MNWLIVAVVLGIFLVTFFFTSLELQLFFKQYGKHIIYSHPLSFFPRILNIKKNILMPIVAGALIGIVFFLLIEFIPIKLTAYIPDLFLGFFIMPMIILLGKSLGNIIIFLYAIKFPDSLTGTATMNDQLRKIHILPVVLASLLILITCTIIKPSPFIIGSIAGTVAFFLFLLGRSQKNPINQ